MLKYFRICLIEKGYFHGRWRNRYHCYKQSAALLAPSVFDINDVPQIKSLTMWHLLMNLVNINLSWKYGYVLNSCVYIRWFRIFQTSRYQDIVKATASGVFVDLKFKISELSDQNWSCLSLAETASQADSGQLQFWSESSEILNLRSPHTVRKSRNMNRAK